MKKKHILDLIRYHTERNEPGFRTAAYAVAEEFRTAGDDQLAFWIEAQLAGDQGFIPQELPATPFIDPCTRLPVDTCPLVLPKAVQRDFMRLVKAVERRTPAHRFLFLGPTGTGKTAAAQMMGRHTDRAVYHIDLADVIGETIQETAGNITRAFAGVSAEGLLVVDGLATLLTSRQTSRPTAAFRKVLSRLHPLTVMVVTADLSPDEARDWEPYFDAVLDFDRYTETDRLKAADAILSHQRMLLQRSGDAHPKLMHRLLQLNANVPNPGTVKTLIRSALILSNPDKPADYLRHLFETLTKDRPMSLQDLRNNGFSVRDIEILTGTPKSTVARLTQLASTDTIEVDTQSGRPCNKNT